MAATDEMQAIALRHRPHAVCIVPERREERTTEGGLEVAREENRLAHFIAPLREAGCRVSIFIAADRRQIEAAHRIGAPVIELHTGAYCEADLAGDAAERDAEMARLRDMAAFAHGLGLEVHAGHGLTFDNVAPGRGAARGAWSSTSATSSSARRSSSASTPPSAGCARRWTRPGARRSAAALFEGRRPLRARSASHSPSMRSAKSSAARLRRSWMTAMTTARSASRCRIRRTLVTNRSKPGKEHGSRTPHQRKLAQPLDRLDQAL